MQTFNTECKADVNKRLDLDVNKRLDLDVNKRLDLDINKHLDLDLNKHLDPVQIKVQAQQEVTVLSECAEADWYRIICCVMRGDFTKWSGSVGY